MFTLLFESCDDPSSVNVCFFMAKMHAVIPMPQGVIMKFEQYSATISMPYKPLHWHTQ